MLVYRCKNLINGKVYIGITTNELSVRKKTHKHVALKTESKTKFYYAIRKYGFENFIWEVIDRAETKEELFDKEKHWIKKLDSFKNGYNSNEGGVGCLDLPKGENHYKAILSDKEVIKVGELLIEGKLTLQEIADMFNVNMKHISDINRGYSRNDVLGFIPNKKRKRHGYKLDGKEKEVVDLLNKGWKMQDIAKHFDVSSSAITKFKKRIGYGGI